MIREAYVHTLEAQLKEALKTDYLGRDIRYFKETDSTNTQAMAWAEAGATEGSIVIAEHQTQGRGRQGRTWESQESRNLLFSIILRPDLPPSHLGLITVITSLSVAEAIHSFTSPLPLQIKWPNDILLNHRKCCGMLIETAHSTAQPQAVVGIGINVNQESFSDEITDRATSMLLESGRHTDRIQLLANILLRLEHYYKVLDEETSPIFIDKYTRRLAYLNESISLRRHGNDEVRVGVIRGISETGALLFEAEGEVEVLHAGEVTTSVR